MERTSHNSCNSYVNSKPQGKQFLKGEQRGFIAHNFKTPCNFAATKTVSNRKNEAFILIVLLLMKTWESDPGVNLIDQESSRGTTS